MYKYFLCIVLASFLLVYGCGTAKKLGKTLGNLATVRASCVRNDCQSKPT